MRHLGRVLDSIEEQRKAGPVRLNHISYFLRTEMLARACKCELRQQIAKVTQSKEKHSFAIREAVLSYLNMLGGNGPLALEFWSKEAWDLVETKFKIKLEDTTFRMIMGVKDFSRLVLLKPLVLRLCEMMGVKFDQDSLYYTHKKSSYGFGRGQGPVDVGPIFVDPFEGVLRRPFVELSIEFIIEMVPLAKDLMSISW